MKIEVAVLGSRDPVPNKPTVSVDVKQHSTNQPTPTHTPPSFKCLVFFPFGLNVEFCIDLV